MPIEKLSQGVLTEESSLPFFDPVNGADRRSTVGSLAEIIASLMAGENVFSVAPITDPLGLSQYRIGADDLQGLSLQYKDAAGASWLFRFPLTQDGAQRFLDITSKRFGAVAGSTDPAVMAQNTAAINAALAASEAGEGIVQVPIGTFNYVGSLEFGTRSCVWGMHQTLSKLVQCGDSYGPHMYCRPTQGAQGDGLKGHIFNLFWDTDGASSFRFNATVTAGSPVVQVSSTAGLAPDYLFAAYGVPKGAYIVSVDSPTQVTLNVNATASNTGVVRNIQSAYAWESYTTSATAGTTTTLPVGSTANIRPGMRCDGSKLSDDEAGDINQNAMVVSVDAAAGTITLDRVPTTTGAFTLRVWRENDCLLVTEAAQAPGYDAAKQYEGPKIEQCIFSGCSGSTVRVRPKRTRTHIRYCRATGARRKGYFFVGATDSYVFRCGATAAEDALMMVSMDTARACGEFFTITFIDRAACVTFRACPEADLYDTDVNGPIQFIAGASSAGGFKWQVRGVNAKWFNSNAMPDGTFPQSVLIDGPATAHLEWLGGCFRSDKPSPNARPSVLVGATGGATANVTGVSFPTALANPQTPFGVALTNDFNAVRFQFWDETNGYYVDTEQTMVQKVFKAMTNNGSSTIPNRCKRRILAKAGGTTTTAWSETTPPNPQDNDELDILVVTAVTAFTLLANTGQVFPPYHTPPTAAAIAAGTTLRYVYNLSDTTWYPRQ